MLALQLLVHRSFFRPVLRFPQTAHRLFAMLAAPEWTKVDPEGELTPPYHIFTKPLEKPQVDDRDYSVIKLENGLTALLIHDAHTKHAAASLDVAVGHLADPVSLQSPAFQVVDW